MEYTEIQMLNWARELKSKYDEAIGNPDLLEVVDQMADFLDEFIKQHQKTGKRMNSRHSSKPL